ncbi:hypothetical protein GC175_31455 [bacterium]|nr:hypothetical protein [bacterium]
MKIFSIAGQWILVAMVAALIVATPATTFAADELNLGRVSGIVWQDSNNNGIHEPQEQTLAGYPVYLQRTSSEVVGTMVAVVLTDAEGGFTFDNLDEGSYQVFTETGDYHLVEVMGIDASAIVDLPVAQMHKLFLPFTVR